MQFWHLICHRFLTFLRAPGSPNLGFLTMQPGSAQRLLTTSSMPSAAWLPQNGAVLAS